MNGNHSIQVGTSQVPDPELGRAAGSDRDRVEAFILLGGGLTPSPLTAATRCSVLDLLVGPGDSTVFARWLRAVDVLNDGAKGNMPVVIANGGGNPAPKLESHLGGRTIEVVIDKESFRGAAGVVRDVSRQFDEDALLLVAEAARCPDFDLSGTVNHHRVNGFDATVLVNPDNTPAGVYLMARKLLDHVQREGYMDLKEQWLNKVVESNHRVGVHRLSAGYSRPLRTREQLLLAARAAFQGGDGQPASMHFGAAVRTSGHGAFSCISPDAVIDESAVIVDSIIMPGARIGASSIVTRSVVCHGGLVSADARLVDAVVGATAATRSQLSPHGLHREPPS